MCPCCVLSLHHHCLPSLTAPSWVGATSPPLPISEAHTASTQLLLWALLPEIQPGGAGGQPLPSCRARPLCCRDGILFRSCSRSLKGTLPSLLRSHPAGQAGSGQASGDTHSPRGRGSTPCSLGLWACGMGSLSLLHPLKHGDNLPQ